MKFLKKELYNAVLTTAAATAVGLVARKVAGTSLGTPESLKGAVKLGAAVKFVQMKKWIPSEIEA